MTTYKHSPSLVAALVYEEGVLVCGVTMCPNAISVDHERPAPGTVGWVLRDGWWLCPGCAK